MAEDFSRALQRLRQLLRTHRNKLVIGFNPHDDPIMREFFAQEAFWQMLHQEDFTDNFEELTPESKAGMDRAIKDLKSLGMLMPLPGLAAPQAEKLRSVAATLLTAESNHIKSTFVDKGLANQQISDGLEAYLQARHSYDMLVAQAVAQHVQSRVDITRMPLAMRVGLIAGFVRTFITTPRGQHIKEALEKCRQLEPALLARVDDQQTGYLVATALRRAKKRVWMGFGDAHFTPCGVHTYVKNPLLLEFYADRSEFEAKQEQLKHPDVFMGRGLKHPAGCQSHAVLLREGEIFEAPMRPASPETIKAEREEALRVTQAARKAFTAERRAASAQGKPIDEKGWKERTGKSRQEEKGNRR